MNLVGNGIAGTLGLSGGGINGTIGLAPRGGGQGLAIALDARNARFGGATALAITRGEVNAQGVIATGRTSFSGTASAQGLSYGSLFVGSMKARGNITNGSGRIDASLSGSRGSRFALDMNALFEPNRIGVAAKGAFAGRPITMPRVQFSRGWIRGGGGSLRPS